jgi:uncharacterized protein (TIRG00374 family)
MTSRAHDKDAPRLSRLSLGLTVRILITAGALWYIAWLIPLDEVGAALANAGAAFVLLGLLAQVSLRFVNALRNRIIARAQGAPLSYRAILTTLFTTAFYGLMLPGSVGAGAATLVKYVGHGATLSAALASMIVNRLFDMSTIIGLAMFYWGLEYRNAGSVFEQRIATLLLVLGPVLLIGFHFILFGRTAILQRVDHVSTRLRIATYGAVGAGIAKVIRQCSVAANLSSGNAAAVSALSILKDLFAAMVAYCFALACGLEFGFVTVAWMQAIVSLLMLLPITISGLGVREGALVLMSARYGVAAPLALTWSLLLFAGTLVVAAIGGMIEAKTLWRSRR